MPRALLQVAPHPPPPPRRPLHTRRAGGHATCMPPPPHPTGGEGKDKRARIIVVVSETRPEQAKKTQPVNGNAQFWKKYCSGPPPNHTSPKSPLQGLSEYTPHTPTYGTLSELEAPIRTIIPQMHTPARTSQCWSRQTPAWTSLECASGCTWPTARATARLRDGRPWISQTAGAPLTQPKHVRTHRGSECAAARGQ